jgi:hypothetical protein
MIDTEPASTPPHPPYVGIQSTRPTPRRNTTTGAFLTSTSREWTGEFRCTAWHSPTPCADTHQGCCTLPVDVWPGMPTLIQTGALCRD